MKDSHKFFLSPSDRFLINTKHCAFSWEAKFCTLRINLQLKHSICEKCEEYQSFIQKKLIMLIPLRHNTAHASSSFFFCLEHLWVDLLSIFAQDLFSAVRRRLLSKICVIITRISTSKVKAVNSPICVLTNTEQVQVKANTWTKRSLLGSEV